MNTIEIFAPGEVAKLPSLLADTVMASCRLCGKTVEEEMGTVFKRSLAGMDLEKLGDLEAFSGLLTKLIKERKAELSSLKKRK
jgi:hypothetical protein